jgi:hypothetical protein
LFEGSSQDIIISFEDWKVKQFNCYTGNQNSFVVMGSFFWIKNWHETQVLMGYFLLCNSLEDLLTYEICFDVEWCNNEGVGNAKNNVEVYWKLWSRKPISFTIMCLMYIPHSFKHLVHVLNDLPRDGCWTCPLHLL